MDFHELIHKHTHSFLEYSEWNPEKHLLYIDIFDPGTRAWSLCVCKMRVEHSVGYPLSLLTSRYAARCEGLLSNLKLARPLKIVKHNESRGVRCGRTRPTLPALKSVIGMDEKDFLCPEDQSPRHCAEIYAVLSAMVYDAHVSYTRDAQTFMDRFPIAHLRFTGAMRPCEIIEIIPYTKPKEEYREHQVRKTAPIHY